MDRLYNFLMVGLGGAAGSMLRYVVTLLFSTLGWNGNLATAVVNVIGSFIIGYLMEGVTDAAALLMLVVGFCGGFTTFSTFSMQSVRLFQEGKFLPLAIYVAGTVILCILFAAAGCFLAKKMY